MPIISQSKKGQVGKERKSFFLVLSFAIGLSLVLSYFAFSPSGSYFVNQTGLGASVGKILGVDTLRCFDYVRVNCNSIYDYFGRPSLCYGKR